MVLFVFLVYFLLFVLSCQYQCKWLPGKTRPQNDLLCVELVIKLYSLLCEGLQQLMIIAVFFNFCIHCFMSSSIICLLVVGFCQCCFPSVVPCRRVCTSCPALPCFTQPKSCILNSATLAVDSLSVYTFSTDSLLLCSLWWYIRHFSMTFIFNVVLMFLSYEKLQTACCFVMLNHVLMSLMLSPHSRVKLLTFNGF